MDLIPQELPDRLAIRTGREMVFCERLRPIVGQVLGDDMLAAYDFAGSSPLKQAGTSSGRAPRQPKLHFPRVLDRGQIAQDRGCIDIRLRSGNQAEHCK